MDIRFLRVEKNNKTDWVRAIVEMPRTDYQALLAMCDGKPVEIKDVEDFTRYIKYDSKVSYG